MGDDYKISRRDLFRVTGAAGAGLAVGAGGFAALRGSAAARDAGEEAAGSSGLQTVAFGGVHQAGIATPQQEHLHFAALDLVTEEASEVRGLLRAWTEASDRMTRGRPAGEENHSEYLPPEDTGEAFDLSPARLTLTFGFGPSFFDRDGEDRFGLAGERPAALTPLPPLTGDVLDEGRSGGDLCIQACADDPQVAFHAVRNLVRISRGLAVVRWSQLGFGRTASTSKTQSTPRNLFGMKDGTNNIKAEDTDLMDRYVWVPEGEGRSWMDGGTYLVARRIRMLIEVWDRVSLGEQEASIGRHKYTGAPIGKEGEFDAVDLASKDANGEPLIAEDAHVRLARRSENEKILRRGYSFTDGFDAERGQLDAGLFFISFQRDPHEQFVPLQRRLAANDRLNEYIRHTSSALFACPPGAKEGGFVGEGLFEKV
ncbi:MAG TPA: iron uptake transporter deferrochelatase/peroxidase subunit [Rubrobacteraceae bacterium]|nr:iron uptake transporter deferrochelatase/peroxidase subunit [Rubrobacteraceae bacterium]